MRCRPWPGFARHGSYQALWKATAVATRIRLLGLGLTPPSYERLLPRNPADEPATVLLERIRPSELRSLSRCCASAPQRAVEPA